MSRAFVKEAEDKAEDLPDRPISPHRNFVTEEGLAAIEALSAALRRPTGPQSIRATHRLPRPRKGKSVIGVRDEQVRKSSRLRPTKVAPLSA